MLLTFAIVTALSQVVAPPSDSDFLIDTDVQPTEMVSPNGAALWKDLVYGMSAEEAAASIRKLAGIKKVQIKYKDKVPRLTISYIAKGVDLGTSMAVIETSFGENGLTEVRLKIDECFSAAINNSKTIGLALKEKYPNLIREQEIDAHGSVGSDFVFFNNYTRVQLNFAGYIPANRQESVPDSGAMGEIADIFGAIASNSAERACPKDSGERIVTTITYVSQAPFLAEQKKLATDKEQVRRKVAEEL